jgi:hypothetical protein
VRCLTALAALHRPAEYPRSSQYETTWLVQLDMGPTRCGWLKTWSSRSACVPACGCSTWVPDVLWSRAVRELTPSHQIDGVIEMLETDQGKLLSFAWSPHATQGPPGQPEPKALVVRQSAHLAPSGVKSCDVVYRVWSFVVVG